MKLYLASSFSLKEKVDSLSKTLENLGFIIPCKWWTGLDFIPSEGKLLSDMRDETISDFYSHPATRNAFERDKKAIEDCDAFVFVADDEVKPYNGANVELGMAIAYGKTCLCVGKLKNSAMYYPLVQFDSIPKLISALVIIKSKIKEDRSEQNKKLISQLADDLTKNKPDKEDDLYLWKKLLKFGL